MGDFRRGLAYQNAEVHCDGRKNGMNHPNKDGEYVGLTIMTDDGSAQISVKISVSQAAALGAELQRCAAE